MLQRTVFVIGALCTTLACGSAVRAQEVLLIQPSTFVFGVIGAALDELDLDYTVARSPAQIEAALTSQSWDIIIIRSLNRSPFSPTVLPLLEAHVAEGRPLHVQVADLENASDRVYDLLGLEGAVDLTLPLSDIFVPTPPHPVWDTDTGGFFPLGDEIYPPDYGDVLIPDSSSFAVSSYSIGGGAAMTIGRGGTVFVNGQQWDNWSLGGVSVARRQISWLLSCKADLDGDGDLTVFDFLEFQTLFDAGDVRADVLYDGRHDIFDFLAYLNLFETGC